MKYFGMGFMIVLLLSLTACGSFDLERLSAPETEEFQVTIYVQEQEVCDPLNPELFQFDLLNRGYVLDDRALPTELGFFTNLELENSDADYYHLLGLYLSLRASFLEEV